MIIQYAYTIPLQFLEDHLVCITASKLPDGILTCIELWLFGYLAVSYVPVKHVAGKYSTISCKIELHCNTVFRQTVNLRILADLKASNQTPHKPFTACPEKLCFAWNFTSSNNTLKRIKSYNSFIQ